MPTEVILKQPVINLGAEADVVKVKPGYARNFLLPLGIAIPATAASKRQIEDLKKKRAEREARELNEAQELAAKLGKLTLTFQMKTGGAEGRKIFGSVTAQDIVARLAEQGHTIEKKKLGLSQSIKTLGETTLSLNLGHGVQSKLKVILEAPVGAAKEEDSVSSKTKKTSRKDRQDAKKKKSKNS